MPSGLIRFILFLQFIFLPAFSAFSSSSSSSSPPLSSFTSENSIFDQPSSSASSFPSGALFAPPPFPNERSVLPGVQVFPQAQSFQGFLGRGAGLGGGAVDLETWSKQQAVRLNQENAVVSHLAQMAPQRRNQLARDMASGNASAANELVGRLMRDLAASQHGQMAFPHFAGGGMTMMDPMIGGTDPALVAAMRSAAAGGGLTSPFSTGSSSSSSFGSLPLALQLQLAALQRQQLLLNGGAGGFRPGGPLGFSGSSPFDRFSAFPDPRNPFQSSGSSSSSDFSDLSRPANPFSSFAGPTQISPLSQSSSSSASLFSSGLGGRGRNDFGRTISGTVRTFDDFLDNSSSRGTIPTNGKGFVDDVTTIEDAFGRRTSGSSRGRRDDDGIRKRRKFLRKK